MSSARPARSPTPPSSPSSRRRPKSRSRAGAGRPARADFLPTCRADLEARGWDEVDVVFVTGDAYVDHPSFAMAILGRWLEANGFRVAILAQPDWQSAEAWRELGRPRLFYAVSAGNMDSMINHYTANRKRRNADAYSPGGRIGLRPDRPTAVYAQRCREAFKGVPVITGGVEASLRRIAHYDYWSDRVWPSNLVSSKADLLAYGMGEDVILQIARRLAEGEPLASLRTLRGVAYLLGKNETLPEASFGGAAGDGTIELPAFDAVREDRRAFAEMTRAFHHETNPANARRLVQPHGDRLLVVNPPARALDEPTMDRLHELPYTRQPHPDCDSPPPAWETIKDSVQIMRGCFGGCTFCSITMHQGREIQSRSPDSILREVERLAASPDFKGGISDLGGPTANMYRMRCTKPEVERVCRRLSCVHPKVCKLLDTDHAPVLDLMRRARAVPGVKRVHIASGIRMDLAADEPEYLEELATHHVGGHLKVAPEHVSDRVLGLMKKPGRGSFEIFAERFAAASKRAGKEQYLVPYFIASHPGSTADEMIELAIFLKERGYRPRQVQDFIPAPMDLATCMYWTGLDPMTMEPVETARRVQDRQVQRALLQFFAPENWTTVRDALRRAGREDLIGEGRDCLIPSRPPRPAGRRPGRGRGAGRPRAGSASAGSGASGGSGTSETSRATEDSRRAPGYRRPSRERGVDRR
ncbi:MAG: YgiQ family radical SAM protein [bacterium]